MSRTTSALAVGLLAPLVALTLGSARAQEDSLGLRPGPAGGGDVATAAADPAAVLEGFFAALDRGDVRAVMASFTDDAVLAGYGLCQVTPCSDLEAIRWEVRRLMDESTQTIPLGEDVQVSAHTVATRLGLTSRSVESAGLERVIVAVAGDTRREKLTSLRLVPDLSDEQTAAFYSWPAVLPVVTATQEGHQTVFAVHVLNRSTEQVQVEIRLFLWGATVVDSFAGLTGHNRPTVTGLADGSLEVGWNTDDVLAARQTGPFVAVVSSDGAPITARVIIRFWGRALSGGYVSPDLVVSP